MRDGRKDLAGELVHGDYCTADSLRTLVKGARCSSLACFKRGELDRRLRIFYFAVTLMIKNRFIVRDYKSRGLVCLGGLQPGMVYDRSTLVGIKSVFFVDALRSVPVRNLAQAAAWIRGAREAGADVAAVAAALPPLPIPEPNALRRTVYNVSASKV